MTPIEFLRAVWPEQGLYCIAVPFPVKGYDHHIFETIEAAAAYVNSVIDTKNVFFGTHTLKERRVWDAKKSIWRVRVQENMRSSRIFFFDLDVEEGNEKKYLTQDSAGHQLKQFCSDVHLPIPMVVSSGGGLHIYWVLDAELVSDEWAIIASKLKQLAHHYGLKIDDMRTTDTSSVLRVAGTFNHKLEGNPRPVLVYKQTSTVNVEAFVDLVDAAMKAAEIKPARLRPVKIGAAALLGTNTAPTFDGPTPTMQDLLRACPQIRRIAAVYGATSDEPEWYVTAGAVKFVLNGRKHFHRISSGHSDYDEETCDAKFDQWQAGPVSCEKMEDSCGAANAHLCHGCPWLTKARFPIIAARLAAKAPEPTVAIVVQGVEVEVKITNPPPPWKRSREEGVTFMAETKEGRAYERKVYSYDFYPIDRSINVGRETGSQQWRVHLPHSATRDITIPASTFVDDKSLMSCLANHDMYPPNFPDLKAYMSAYIRELQRLTPTAEQHNHLGWVDNHTKFVLGTRIFMPDGSEISAQLAKVAATSKSYIGEAGTLEKQVELMKFYQDRRYAAQQMYILSSLGSPLLFATPHNGFIIHAYGETGGSKSSAMFTAASFWGNPKKYVLNCTEKGATELYRSTRLGVLNNLPCCLDEITSMKEEIAKDFALGSSQNILRVRLQRDGTPQESLTGDERASIIMSNANVSLQSLLAIRNAAGVAGAARVFEIRFEKNLGVHKPMQANIYLRDLFENYGWIGENYMRLVVVKREKVKAAVDKTLDKLADDGGMAEEERFWFTGAATALVAGDISGKLGYVVYDLPYLRDWFLKHQLPEMRCNITEQTASTAPLAVLMDYLAHINGSILQTKTFAGTLQPNIQDQFRGQQMLAHHLMDQKIIHILKQDFRLYCERLPRYSQEVLKALAKSGVVTAIDKRVTLGEGTPLAKGRASCFTVNLSHPDIAAVKIGQP